MQQMNPVNKELSRFAYCEYLNTMSVNELVYWLINSFSPERYRNPDDVIEFAIRLIYFKSNQPELITELVRKLWGMFGLEPDPMNCLKTEVVSPFRKLS